MVSKVATVSKATLLSLTAKFFESGPSLIPTKSQNPSIWGSGDLISTQKSTPSRIGHWRPWFCQTGNRGILGSRNQVFNPEGAFLIWLKSFEVLFTPFCLVSTYFSPIFQFWPIHPTPGPKKTPVYEGWVQSSLRIFPTKRIFSFLNRGHRMMYFHLDLNIKQANQKEHCQIYHFHNRWVPEKE